MAAFLEGIYTKFGKRMMDIVASACGLLVLSLPFAFVALCIKLDSSGSVFYRQVRVGIGGRLFRILKFRTMDAVSSSLPAGITVSGDNRITKVGKILRKYKIDELPQLWNVLCGQMSLVGPRPELPKYVETYSSEQRQVLSVRPGITDPAALAYRHEEELLSHSGDPDVFYRTQILPDKLDRNLAYIRRISLRCDLMIIFQTIIVSALPVHAAAEHKNPLSGKDHQARRDFVNPSSGSSI
jgi:lipopolysaccharide/colanic/teichoic acid biosynthesis glycosyltransferase